MIPKLRTLEEVLRWCDAERPAPALVEVLAQDEFTNDVVIARRGEWLVFDTT